MTQATAAAPAWRGKALEVARVLGTIVLSLIFGAALCVGLTLVVPAGASRADNFLYAAIAFPLIWVGLSLWLLGTRRRLLSFGLTFVVSAACVGAVLWGATHG